jgi:hypothetical protein
MAFKKKIDIGTAEGVKFEVIGQSLEGYYMGTFDVVIQQRDVKKHVFKTADGLVSVLGQAHLTQLLGGIEPGILTRVTYVGTKKTKQPQPMKLFEVEYDEDQREEVGQIQDRAPVEEPAEEEEVQEDYAAEDDVPVEQLAPPPVRRPAPAPAARPAPAPARTTVSAAQADRAKQLLGKK